ncbi:MAG: 7TM diverse intracellular signaling domain-containing protein, partial [Bacteroidota bacterium]
RPFLWLCCGMLLLVSCGENEAGSRPRIENGWLDLRQHDFAATGTVPLRGAWEFFWEELLFGEEAPQNQPLQLPVPGSWTGLKGADGPLPVTGYGTYRLRVLLPGDGVPLCLRLADVRSAMEVELNGKPVFHAGKVGASAATTLPHFRPMRPIPVSARDTLTILVRAANFHHCKSGFGSVPVIGAFQEVYGNFQFKNIWSGIYFGIAAIAGILHFGIFFFQRTNRTHLYFSLMCFLLGLGALGLSGRITYEMLGPSWWALAYKMELGAHILAVIISIYFFRHLYPVKFPQSVVSGISIMMGLQFAWLVLLPTRYGSWMEYSAPFTIFLIFGVALIHYYRAGKKGYRSAWGLLAVMLAGMISFAIESREFILEHADDLVGIHFLMPAFVVINSVILAQDLGKSWWRIRKLSNDLEIANSDLEAQNESLEKEVAARTERLMESERKAHELELEMKRRDLETVSANNAFQLQFTQQVVDALQNLLKEEGAPRQKIRQLIHQLREQISTEEKLQLLHGSLDQVNAEFYTRLQSRFPQLSKTERELCACIKLELSSKEIAALRNTSVNTINVTRHRLRKKLGISREVELEAFIQQL